MIAKMTKVGISILLLLPLIAQADAEIEQVKEKLKQTFTNYTITDIRESPIPGLMEIHAGPQIHYFYPDKELLIFGQIWTSEGENLTEKAKQESIETKRSRLQMDSAILVQKGDIPIIEIVNPDCSFCKRYEKWVTQLENVYSIERKVIFLDSPTMFPKATAKMLSVLCSEDKIKAYTNMVAGDPLENETCVAGEKVLAAHQEITDTLGVTGTPTFLLPNGKVISGFKQKELELYFINSASKANED